MTFAPTVVIAGANGFVGSSVARLLVQIGWNVVALLRLGGRRDRLVALRDIAIIEVPTYSLEVLRKTLSTVRPDVVINMAAAGVQPGRHTEADLIQENVRIVESLLRATAGRHVRRFLHIGSYAEYAPGVEGVLMNEDWPQEPRSAYGGAKLAATHHALIEAERLGMPLTVIRLFGVYGPGEASHRLLPALLRKLAVGQVMELTPGRQQRDWIFIDDAAEAVVAAASAFDLGPSGSILNVCTGQAASVEEVCEWARKLYGCPPEQLQWGALSYRPDEPMWAVGDGCRFREATGWQARSNWQEGVRLTVAAHQSTHSAPA